MLKQFSSIWSIRHLAEVALGRLSEDHQPPREDDAVGAVLHSGVQQLGLLLCPWASKWWQFRSHEGRCERTGNGHEGAVLECCVTQAKVAGSYCAWFWVFAEWSPGSKALGNPRVLETSRRWVSAGHCHGSGNIHKTERTGGLDNQLQSPNHSYFMEE